MRPVHGLHSSIPVVIETFTFLDRNADRHVALTWKQAIYKPGIITILPCDLRDLAPSCQLIALRWPQLAATPQALCDFTEQIARKKD
jgi:hypothetical protein